MGERRWHYHEIQPSMLSSKNLQEIINGPLSSVSEVLRVPLCVVEAQFLRADEVCGFAQLACITHILCCAGGRRELSQVLRFTVFCRYSSFWHMATLHALKYFKGGTRGLLGFVLFDDPVVIFELDEGSLWDGLEAGISMYLPHKRAEWSLPDVFEIPPTGDL